MFIRAGSWTFNSDGIDCIKLNGDGSYTVTMYRPMQRQAPQTIQVEGDDADQLREYLDEDREVQKIELENTRISLEINRAHAKQHEDER